MSHSTGSEPSYQENTPAALLVQASDVNARPLRVRRMADSMLQNGQEAPFMVVSVSASSSWRGFTDWKACRSLGEQTVEGYSEQARRH
jgi:hypothetical protein